MRRAAIVAAFSITLDCDYDRNHQALVSGAWVYRKRNSF
nr:MAG TPA_asm: hypothetical protein [Caudoviricetes sp.]DAO35515.1 MAG TPA: hypothetical protein [Caudoviricetes sp.]